MGRKMRPFGTAALDEGNAVDSPSHYTGGEDAETPAEALERAEGIAASLRSVQTSLLEL